MNAKFVGKYFDTDIMLRDAAIDALNRPTRRMIASSAIGVQVDDAYYSLREMREAISWIPRVTPADRRTGAAR